MHGEEGGLMLVRLELTQPPEEESPAEPNPDYAWNRGQGGVLRNPVWWPRGVVVPLRQVTF
jgi:hypothetical protein